MPISLSLFYRLRILILMFLLSPFIFELSGGRIITAAQDMDTPGSWRDRGELEVYLSEKGLTPVEGIWEYPDDEVTLSIISDNDIKGTYCIYVVEAIDCRLWQGMRVGSLTATPDPDRFRISLCSQINGNNIPGVPKEGEAKLTGNGESLEISMPSLKISFTPSLIFPTLWNRLRLGLRIKTTDPANGLPKGWVKTFPSYDGNGSRRSIPRYL